jgi:hypothetical protein
MKILIASARTQRALRAIASDGRRPVATYFHRYVTYESTRARLAAAGCRDALDRSRSSLVRADGYVSLASMSVSVVDRATAARSSSADCASAFDDDNAIAERAARSAVRSSPSS